MDIGAASAGSSTGTSAAGSQKAVISSDFETFLKMLSTQLKNQDPLDPMDSTDGIDYGLLPFSRTRSLPAAEMKEMSTCVGIRF